MLYSGARARDLLAFGLEAVLVVDGPSAAVSLCQVRDARQRTLKCPGHGLSRLVLDVAIVLLCVWKKSCFILNGFSSINYSYQSPISRVVWVLRTSTCGALRIRRRRNNSLITFRSSEYVWCVLTCAIHRLAAQESLLLEDMEVWYHISCCPSTQYDLRLELCASNSLGNALQRIPHCLAVFRLANRLVPRYWQSLEDFFHQHHEVVDSGIGRCAGVPPVFWDGEPDLLVQPVHNVSVSVPNRKSTQASAVFPV